MLGIGSSKHSEGWWKAVKCQWLKAEAFIKVRMLGKGMISNVSAALTNPVTQSHTKKWGGLVVRLLFFPFPWEMLALTGLPA